MRLYLNLALDTLLFALRNSFYLGYSTIAIISLVLLVRDSEYADAFGIAIQWVLVTVLLGAVRIISALLAGHVRLLALTVTHDQIADEWDADGRRSAAALLRAYIRSNERVIDKTFLDALGPRAAADAEERARAEASSRG